MTHAFLYVPSRPGTSDDEFEAGAAAFAAFKRIRFTDTSTSDLASIAVAPAVRIPDKRIARSYDDKVWAIDIGTWLPLPAQSGCHASWLIEQYKAVGIWELARRLQGQFAVIIVDLTTRTVHVVTDRCGTLHVFWRRGIHGDCISTSAAALAAHGDAKLDPVGVHEFVSTGIIYEDRSLWDGIRKIPPASIVSFGDGQAKEQRYWSFSEVSAESLDLEGAVEQTHHALVQVLISLPETADRLVSDLTGGYDSRLLLAGLLAAGRGFDTTVSGKPDQADVIVANRIAVDLGLRHGSVVPTVSPTAEEFETAVRMTDGEYDAFDYARILATHRRLVEGHGMSLNGSFGELARGYWWELLWPRLARNERLDVSMVARKRFAAMPYDTDVFRDTDFNLVEHMTGVARRAIAPIVALPNTAQMDCVYFTLRMQRWQGRIASSTNQLWPACSPMGFAQVLEPILSAKAGTRFRSLLARRLFERFQPILAQIPLEHGYPPLPATAFNLWRFAPLVRHYGGKVVSKLSARLGVQSSKAGAVASACIPGSPEMRDLVRDTAFMDWSNGLLLQDTRLFKEERVSTLLVQNKDAGRRVDQWRRMVTLEAILRLTA